MWSLPSRGKEPLHESTVDAGGGPNGTPDYSYILSSKSGTSMELPLIVSWIRAW